MVGKAEEPPEKTIKEIQRETKEEIARAARLAKDAERGKMHNDL
jgi:predicted DNA-binding transcriptional regulator